MSLLRTGLALTTDETETWWGSPDTYRITEWKADLRVGGPWSIVVPFTTGHGFLPGGSLTRKLANQRRAQPFLGRGAFAGPAFSGRG
jgi:hypothetical protein